MRKVRPHGPYLLCGYSFGGVVAYEMACQILAAGEEVEFLGLVDTENPAVEARKLSLSERVAVNWTSRNERSASALEKFGNLSKRVGSGLAYRLYFEAEDAVARHLPDAKSPGWLRQVQLRKAHERAMEAYVPGKFSGTLTLFRAKDAHKEALVCLDRELAPETVDRFKGDKQTFFICLELALDTTKKWNLKHHLSDRLNAM